jgi:hypothetical protein
MKLRISIVILLGFRMPAKEKRKSGLVSGRQYHRGVIRCWAMRGVMNIIVLTGWKETTMIGRASWGRLTEYQYCIGVTRLGNGALVDIE